MGQDSAFVRDYVYGVVRLASFVWRRAINVVGWDAVGDWDCVMTCHDG